MKTGIYAIRDNKAEVWATPFFQKSNVHAVRAAEAEVNRTDPTNTLYTHPKDFSLHKIGEYDETSGEITALPETLLCQLEKLVKPEVK